MQDTLNKTLIIRFSSVGDIVLSSLLVRVLRRRFPRIQIDFAVKSEFAELVRHNPHITRVIELPPGGSFGDLARLRRSIGIGSYDLVIDIHDSIRSRFLSLGARTVVRINKRKIARFLLVKFKRDLYARFGGAPGVAHRYLETVEFLGVHDDGGGLEVHVPEAACRKVDLLLADHGMPPGTQAIGICPSAKHANKMWMKERFAEAAVNLARRYQAPVVLFGSGEEAARCSEIADLMRARDAHVHAVVLAGVLSLTETAAAMDHCSVVLSNDSGLMHIAAARKRKLVALFGPTVRQLGFFPFGTESIVVEDPALPCRPCTPIGLPECPLGHFLCMKNLAVGRVVSAAVQLMESHQ